MIPAYRSMRKMGVYFIFIAWRQMHVTRRRPPVGRPVGRQKRLSIYTYTTSERRRWVVKLLAAQRPSGGNVPRCSSRVEVHFSLVSVAGERRRRRRRDGERLWWYSYCIVIVTLAALPWRSAARFWNSHFTLGAVDDVNVTRRIRAAASMGMGGGGV